MNVVFSMPLAVVSQYIFGPLIFILSLFMVLLILVQRGKGGGLTGALGGPGGQSAFGTKAGDLFTRITIVAASLWIFLLGFTVWWFTESDFSSALGDVDVSGSSMSIGAPSTGSSPATPDIGVVGNSSAAMIGAGNSTSETSTSEKATSETATPEKAIPSTNTTPSDQSKPVGEVEVGELPAKASESTTLSTEATPESPSSPLPEK